MDLAFGIVILLIVLAAIGVALGALVWAITHGGSDDVDGWGGY